MLHQGRGSNFDHNNSLMYEQHEFVPTASQQQQQQRLYRRTKKKNVFQTKTVETIFSIHNDWWKNARAKIITFSDLCVVEIDFY